MMASLFDTFFARAPVVPVSAPIVPSTPSAYTRYTATVTGNVKEFVGWEPKEFVVSPELVVPRLDSRCLFRTDWSLRGLGWFDWDDIVSSGRADAKSARDLAHSVGTAGVTYTKRYMAYVRGAYQIRSSLRFDRLFLTGA